MSGEVYTVTICLLKQLFGCAYATDVKEDISIFLGVENNRVILFKNGEELSMEEKVYNGSLFDVFI
jgi:hypothetical protein